MARDSSLLRPFWVHQGAEYLLGAVLVAQGLQSPTPTVPAIAGGLIVANAAIVEGPLGAFRAVSRRAHRWLDVVVLAIVIVLAVLPGLDVDNTSRLLMVALAAILAFLWWNTRFEKVERQRREGRAGDAVGSAGRLVGTAVREARRRRGS